MIRFFRCLVGIPIGLFGGIVLIFAALAALAQFSEQKRVDWIPLAILAMIGLGSVIVSVRIASGGMSASYPRSRIWRLLSGSLASSRRGPRWTDDPRLMPLARIIDDSIHTHGHALLAQKRMKTHTDPYGLVLEGAWLRELDYFYVNIIAPQLWRGVLSDNFERYVRKQLAKRGIDFDSDDPVAWMCKTEIDVRISRIMKAHPVNQMEIDKSCMSPSDFERFCASELVAAGWEARVQGGSGDQGVDIVARRGGVVAVFQCKFYTNSVGNFAVQEIHTGRHFHNATLAAVVSNVEFTSGARAAAMQTGVHLLHHSQLRGFAMSESPRQEFSQS